MGLQDPFKGHIDVALSTFAMRYSNNDFLADLLAPRVPVQKQADKYWIHGRENMQGAGVDDVRAPGAAAKRITRSRSTDSFMCDDHSWEDVIPDEERGNQDDGDPEQATTGVIMDRLFLRRDKLLATILGDTAQVTQNVTLAGNDQWSSTDAASKPIEDVALGQETIVQNGGKKPNTLVLGGKVFTKLRSHSRIEGRIQNVKLGNVSVEDLQAIFDVERVLVWNTVERSDAGANTFIYDKHACLMYVNPRVTLDDVAFLKTFVWVAAPGTVGGFKIEKGRAQPVSRNSDEVAGHVYYDHKITGVELAYLVKNAVA